MKHPSSNSSQAILLFTTLLITGFSHFTQSKVLIFTYAYNRPDFIILQNKTFEKFLQDDYEFLVFNDATNPDNYREIKDTCKSLNVTCIDIPQEIHDRPYLHRPTESQYAPYHQPSVRNSNVVQYSLDTIGFDHNDIVLLIDSDMFLIKPFSAKKFMNGYDLAGFYKQKGEFTGIDLPFSYLWIGLIFLNSSSLPHKTALNFNCGVIDDVFVDAGGYSYLFLEHVKTARIQSIDRICLRDVLCTNCLTTKSVHCNHNTKLLQQLGFNDNLITFIQKMPMLHGNNIHRNAEFLLENTFLHYRAGTNYNNAPKNYNANKTTFFNECINKLLNS